MEHPRPEESKRAGVLARFKVLVQRVPPSVELVVVYAALCFVGWIWLPPVHAAGDRVMETIGLGIIGFIFLWMLYISHHIRNKPGGELGFSTVGEFKFHIKNLAEKKDFWVIIMVFSALVVPYWFFITNFIPFTSLIPGLEPANDLLVKRATPLVVFIVATLEYGIIAAYTGVFFIKINTLKAAILKYLKYGTPFIVGLFVWAWVQYGERILSYTLAESIANFAGYVYWALAQQATILVYTATMIDAALETSSIKTRRGKDAINVLVTASVFAFLHFPAWILSFIAFIMELVIASVYVNPKTRNIFAACLVHAIAGLVIVFFLDIDLVTGYLALFP